MKSDPCRKHLAHMSPIEFAEDAPSPAEMEGVRAVGALTFETCRRVSLQVSHPKPPANIRGTSDPLSIPDFETLFDTIARGVHPKKSTSRAPDA
jgi:hypothetical protein